MPSHSTNTVYTRKIAGSLLLGAGVIYLVTEAITASAWKTPAYSYARNYISDLGVTEQVFYGGHAINSPWHIVMNSGFVLHGLLFVLGAICAAAVSQGVNTRFYLAVAVLHAIGNSLVGFFPENVTELHSLGALLAIGFGNLAIILGGWQGLRPLLPGWLSSLSLVLGSLGLASFAFLLLLTGFAFFPELLTGAGGAIERLSVYTISSWDFLVGITLLVGRKSFSESRNEWHF